MAVLPRRLFAATLTTGLLLAGCAEDSRPEPQIGEPVAVELARPDAELSGLLNSLLRSAREDPQSSESRGRLAMAYEVNGFSSAALISYEQAEGLDRNEFLWPYFRAMLLAQRGNHADALASVDRALAIDGEYLPALLWRGSWLLEQDHHAAATAAYQRAGELGARAPASVGVARILLRQGQPAAAAAILEPVSGQLHHPYIYRMLGQAYRALGRTEDAGIAFARGRQDRPWQGPDPRAQLKQQYIASFGGRLVRAENLLQAGDYQEALQILQALSELRPDDPALLTSLSEAYARVGRLERARAVLLRGFEVHPDNYFFHLLIAGIYYELGTTDLALQHMQRAIEVIPERASGHQQLGSLLLAQGRDDDALAALDTALRYGVNNPEQVLYTTGMIERARQRWPQAIARFEQAAHIDESFTLAHIHLAQSRAEIGRFEEANSALAWARRLGTHPDAVTSVGKRLAELEAQEASRSQ